MTDNARNAALNATVGTVIGDFKFTYENNTNVTKEAIVNIISENGNYEGSISKKFIILKATLDVITPYDLSSTVDSLLSSIDMSKYNVGGIWSFVEEPTTIVATSVGDGSVIKEVKFTPTDSDNYETLTRETVIIIRLNNSSVKFDDEILTDDGILTKVYDTYTFNIDKAYINKLDENGNKYESEFDSDPIQFRWYDEAGNEILAPKDVGEYKVQVTVPANRKYKSATSKMTSVTITKANISVASIEFIDFDAEPNKYQYTTKQICPEFVLSYNDDTDLKDSINKTYKNNIELTSVDNVPTITVTATATGNYEGTTSFTFDIVKRDIATVDLADIVDQYFNGQPVEVQLTLTNYGTVLVLNKDFEVIYTDNDKVGTATITITGIGKYTGERIEGFEIIKKLIDSSNLPELSNLTAYVGTKLKDIELPSNEFGSWVFVLVANKEENALDPTVGAANANGTNFDVEFRDLNNEYSPTQDHISIVVIKYTGTITNISDISKVYNTKSVNDPTYTYNGDSLERNVKYYQNGVELDVAPKAAGNYEVVITTSETEMYTAAEGRKSFTISRARIGKTGDATADAIIEEIAIQPYQNGAQVKPTVVINHNIGENETIQLSGTTDFDVIYSANNEQGPAAGTVYVFGLGNYYTTNSYETVTFDIGEGTTPPGIEDPEGNEIIVDIAFDNYDYQFVPTYVYTGEEITPTITVKNITDTDSITDIDPKYYDVEFTNNINKGTATVTITFKDGYDGSYSETFKIDPYALTKENVHAEYDQNDEVVVVVKAFGNKVPNTEYTFVIDGENVIVTGKNNYSDTVTVEIEGKEPNVITIKNNIYKFYTINKRGKLKEQTSHTYSESTTVYLRNVADETTIDVFLQQFVNTRRLYVRDMNGSLIDSLDYQDICIGTGCTLELYDINDKLIDKVTVVVVNDFNGDGRISRPDKSTLDGLVSGTVTNELMVMAGDYRVDGGCDAEEYEILLQSFDRGSTFDPNEKYRIQ